MRRFWPVLLFAIVFIVVASRFEPAQTINHTNNTSHHYQRIISLAPSITETLFSLDLGDKLVAVTDYCDYPAAAQSLPKVGGYIDSRLESILEHQPDLVIMLDSQQALNQQLQQLGIETLTVNNSRLIPILKSIESIADKTGQWQQAEQLLGSIQHTIQQVQVKVTDQPAPRVLVSIAHYNNTDTIDQIFVAGQNDFYNDLIELAGGKNVYLDTLIKVPSVSTEGLINLNPDIIIDVFPEADDHQLDLDNIRQQWLSLPMINAVKHHQVHLIEQDYASVPGPRIFKLLPLFAQILHPELDWQHD